MACAAAAQEWNLGIECVYIFCTYIYIHSHSVLSLCEARRIALTTIAPQRAGNCTEVIAEEVHTQESLCPATWWMAPGSLKNYSRRPKEKNIRPRARALSLSSGVMSVRVLNLLMKVLLPLPLGAEIRPELTKGLLATAQDKVHDFCKVHLSSLRPPTTGGYSICCSARRLQLQPRWGWKRRGDAMLMA